MSDGAWVRSRHWAWSLWKQWAEGGVIEASRERRLGDAELTPA
ncbi:MAG: hypothetical protein ACKOD3_01010 [Phenylobacterium sp.]